MTSTQINEPTRRKPLRLWPGVVAVVLQWLVRFGVPIIVPGFLGFRNGMMGGMLGALLIVLWWVFFSRAPWSERLGAIVLMVVTLFLTMRINHPSLGPLWLVGYAVPVLSLALVVWAVASRRLADGPRRLALVATVLLACGGWTLARTSGIDGNHIPEFSWRWVQSPEERLLAQAGDEPVARPSALATAETGTAWPGFRGADRDSIIRGVQIETDWETSPPVELWRRPIGPGWSSFAVHGDLIYTQEQRGDDELVTCYNATTGEPVWRHRDAARFWESNAGAGPRATPTLSNGRVYTFGATGILNALDAADGTVLWSRNAASDTEAEIPEWGFTSSPLVIEDLVIVDAGAPVAYDHTTGNLRWSGPASAVTYSSPHLVTLDGVAQILLLNGAGVISVAPADGKLLWEHPWSGFGIVQPALTADGDILVSAGAGIGTSRLAVANSSGTWTVEERWTSIRLKAYFSDFVVHKGHAYGFDDRILACLDVADGERKWKGGRYGNGQLILLADQDLLLVLSEKGELALVSATPDAFSELARKPAIKGKTWNHPTLVGDRLLVRNDQEMAAFRIPRVGS